MVILSGETGVGKSTQIPQYLMDAGWADEGHIIGCTQPKRLACTSLAGRVSEEVGCSIGDKVAYSVPFDDTSNQKTRIKYMTDEMLLRETLVDPLLSAYSVIILDDAHERSLYTDLSIGILRK